MLAAWTISSGSELIRGRSTDTNAGWLAARLSELGLPCVRHVTTGDDLAQLVAVLREAASAARVVVLTGGLGPTEDDLTRSALAQASATELELDPASLHAIEGFFAARQRAMPAANRVQAFLPRGARAIPNNTGTAPGIQQTIANCELFALPGVPHEMRTMFTNFVAPRLAALGGGTVQRYACLQCCGLAESEIGDAIKDLMQRGRNPDVGTTASAGIIGVRIYADGPSAAAADELLARTEAEVRRRLGTAVFGRNEDTLASVVGEQLAGLNRTIATAESCTGGLIGKCFTDISGSSRYFRGGIITYSDDLKVKLLGVSADELALHGAVSAGVAREMASGVREHLSADYGISATGIAGPGGGTPDKPVGLVYIGLADAGGAEFRELHLGADSPRFLIRERAVGIALNWLRLRLLAGSAKE